MGIDEHILVTSIDRVVQRRVMPSKLHAVRASNLAKVPFPNSDACREIASYPLFLPAQRHRLRVRIAEKDPHQHSIAGLPGKSIGHLRSSVREEQSREHQRVNAGRRLLD